MNLMDKEKQERIDQRKAGKITFWQHSMSMISWVINPKKIYQNPVQTEKSRLLSIFILILLIAYGGVDIFGPISPRIPILYYFRYGLMIGAIFLNRYVHYLIASRLTVLLIPFLIFSSVYSGSAIPITLFYFLVLGLILGSFLIRKRGIIILGVINSLGIFLASFTLSTNNLTFESIISPLVINLIATVLIVIKMTHNDLARRSNQSIDNQESQFGSIFYNSPVGILIAREGSIISEANQAACDLLGYANDELVGMKIPELTYHEDRARTLEMFWKIVAAEMPSFSMEVRFLKKNGQIIWVNLNSTLLFEDTGIPIYGIAIIEDITEKKKAKDALSIEKENAQKYLDIAGVMFVALDNFGYVTLINQKGCEVLGYNQDEIIGKNWFDHFLPDDDKNNIKTVFEEMMVGDSPPIDTFQNRVLTKAGVERTITWHNTILTNQEGILGTLSAGEDITNRLKADEEFHQQADKLQAILDNTQDWIWEIDTEGKHIYSNFAVENILGLSKERSLGDDLFHLMHEEDRQMVEESFPNWISEKKGWRNLVVRWKHKDGSWRFLESNAEPSFDINGNITGFRGVDRDITHRIKAERDLRQSEQNLKRAQKVAKLGSWIWNSATQKFEMSDELSTVLGIDESKERPSFDSIVHRVHPDDMPKFQKSIDESRINKETDTIDYRFWHELDQRYIHLQVETELEAIQGTEGFILYGTVQDITDRKNVEDALRSSEIRYRTLFDNSADGISLHDGPEYIDVNDTWLKMFGLKEEDVIGKTPFDFSPYYQPDGLVSETKGKEFLSQVSEGQEIFFEWRHTHSNGSEFDVEVAMTLTQISGKTVHISFLRDITERKQYEESLQSRVNQLNILQQVSAICLENTDENNIIAEITSLIGKNFYPDHFGIMLLDDTDKALRIHPSYQGLAEEDYTLEIKLGDGVAGKVARNNQPMRIADVSIIDDYIAPSISQQSELCVPISINNMVFGVINAESKIADAFSDEDERLLETVADQLALALQKSRLYQEEKQRRQEAEANRAASAALTSSLELTEVLDNILENLRKVVRSDQASIHLFENNHIKIVAGSGFMNPDEIIGFTYPFNNQLAKEIYQTKEALVLNDAQKDPRFQNFGLINTRGWMGIPLIEQEEVIGYITIDSNQPGAYTKDDADQVQVFANNATGAIVKARLFEEEKKRRLEVEIQQDISSTMANSLDLDSVLNSALENLQRYLDYDSAGILLQENGYMRIVAVRGFNNPDQLLNKPVPINHQLYQDMKKTKSVGIIDDVSQDKRFEDFGADSVIKGWMGVPLIDQGRVFGYLSFDSKESGKFTQEMGRLAQVLVNQTAAAITKAKLFEDTQLGLKRLEALHEIDRIITSSVELDFAIKQIMQIVVAQLNIDAASLVMYDPDSLTFNPINSIGFRSKEYNQRQLFGNGYASKVALSRQTLRIDDQEELFNHYSSSEGILNEDFRCYLGVPLIAKGEIKGVLELFHRSALQTTSEWDSFVETLATQLAIAIDNSQMFESLQRSNLELTLSYDATIEGWAKTLELRDQETQGHSERVTAMTVKLAQAMGMTEEELIHVRRGALLHDVGKIGIPDSILQKPEALNEEERKVMENHTTLAFNVLSGSVFLEKALDIPYSHHEKWDGSGYPKQLSGDQIPLSARVFAIIDVYDALRSDRPYRDAWSKQKTIKYIREQSGSHFDPKVVDAFLKLVDNDPDFNVYK